MGFFTQNLKFDIRNSIIGEWKFDEGSGSVAYDSSGNGKHGNLTNSPPWVLGKRGYALSFNGSSQYILTNQLITSATTNITMSAWVNLSNPLTRGCIVHIGRSSGTDPQSNGFCMGVGATTMDDNGNNLIGLLDNVSWMNFASAIGLGWRFVAITRDATTWRGYIDGVLLATTFSGNPSAPTIDSAIGFNNTGSGRYFPGFIDDVRVFSRQLSTLEIADLYRVTR